MENIVKQIDTALFRKISEAADESNIELWLIGGFVRDIFLGRESKDIDIVAVGDGIKAANKIAKKLNFKENDEFFKFERLRLIENKPFLLEKTYLSTKKIANLKQEDLKNNSLFKLIKNKYNIKLKNAEAEIEAVILNDQVAKKMKVKEGMLGLYFEQISRDENDEIIEYTSAYYRNDNYKFKFKFDLE
mgnify:CR=1 FL=1